MNVNQYPVDAVTNSDAIPWLPDAFAYVNVDLGVEFKNLVFSWIALKRTSHWKSSSKVQLSHIKRPTLLAQWVNKKRYKTSGNEPKVEEECGVGFKADVKEWWTSLQPKWRQGVLRKQLSSLNSVPRDQWKQLDKFGINGWFSILVCLKWWGMNLLAQTKESRAEGMQEWLEMIEDVRYMMDCLTVWRQT
ncbi:hypothetical protein C8R42DRAFT_568162 [Lentinula raphanica]|nr:hypothetical protein C8R42DRAFT_568162 [Lentinula raphanica]